jgi:hypothetical protein
MSFTLLIVRIDAEELYIHTQGVGGEWQRFDFSFDIVNRTLCLRMNGANLLPERADGVLSLDLRGICCCDSRSEFSVMYRELRFRFPD